MSGLLAGVVVAIFAGASLLVRRLRADHLRARWGAVIRECNLTIVSSRGFSSTTIRARSDKVLVLFSALGDDDVDTRIEVIPRVAARFPYSVHTPLHGTSGARAGEVQVGDGGFDAMFVLWGPPDFLLAILDKRTREILVNLARQARVDISNGRVAATFRSERSEQQPGQILKAMLEAEARFSAVERTPYWLVHNARNDPMSGVRLANVLALCRHHATSALTRPLLFEARSDQFAEIRLHAALELGSEGLQTLRELAEDESVDELVATQALITLGTRFPSERATELARSSLRAQRREVATACVRLLGSHRESASRDLLLRILASETGLLAEATAAALGKIGGDSAEQALVQALESEAFNLVSISAEALGSVGSVAAIEPLRAAETRLGDRAFSRTVRQAIASIQARVPGAAPGQLSLAPATGGQLSLADAGRGQLSLPPADVGAHSLPSTAATADPPEPAD